MAVGALCLALANCDDVEDDLDSYDDEETTDEMRYAAVPGGNVTQQPPGFYPQIVEVGLLHNGVDFNPTCTGVLVGEQTVLTAEHCITSLTSSFPTIFCFTPVANVNAEVKVRFQGNTIFDLDGHALHGDQDLATLSLSSNYTTFPPACLSKNTPSSLVFAGQRNDDDASPELPTGPGCTGTVPGGFVPNCIDDPGGCYNHSVGYSTASYTGDTVVVQNAAAVNGDSGGGAFTPFGFIGTWSGLALQGIAYETASSQTSYVRVDQASGHGNWVINNSFGDSTVGYCP